MWCNSLEELHSISTQCHKAICYVSHYQTFEEAEGNISQFITDVYTTKRLHSSLGYLPHNELEMANAQGLRC
jgi:hypothetical protein